MKYIKIFESMKTVNESTEITNKEIYQEEISKGNAPEKVAEFVLDIITSGTWVAWDQEKIDKSINKIINLYE